MVEWSFRVGGERLPRATEFKYLGILFRSDGKADWLYWTVVVKRKLSQKVKLSAAALIKYRQRRKDFRLFIVIYEEQYKHTAMQVHKYKQTKVTAPACEEPCEVRMPPGHVQLERDLRVDPKPAGKLTFPSSSRMWQLQNLPPATH